MSTSNPLHAGKPQIFLICVMRYTDKTVVASYSSDDVSKEGVRELIASNSSVEANKKYCASGDSQSIYWTMDEQGRVYALVTNPRYNPRIAFAALDQLQIAFKKEWGFRVSSASENSLSKPARPVLKEISQKYADPSAGDALTSVQEKLDVVKSTMKDNIQQLLVNDEKMERIAESAESLNEQSAAFRQNTKALSNQMWWKMWKMRLLIGGCIIICLVIIITPVVVMNTKH